MHRMLAAALVCLITAFPAVAQDTGGVHLSPRVLAEGGPTGIAQPLPFAAPSIAGEMQSSLLAADRSQHLQDMMDRARSFAGARNSSSLNDSSFAGALNSSSLNDSGNGAGDSSGNGSFESGHHHHHRHHRHFGAIGGRDVERVLQHQRNRLTHQRVVLDQHQAAPLYIVPMPAPQQPGKARRCG